MKQLTLATVGFERYAKTTRRAVFLVEMDERSALLRIAKLEDIPPDGHSRHRPDADRAALVDTGAVAGDAPDDGLAVSIGAICRQRADLVLLRVD